MSFAANYKITLHQYLFLLRLFQKENVMVNFYTNTILFFIQGSWEMWSCESSNNFQTAAWLARCLQPPAVNTNPLWHQVELTDTFKSEIILEFYDEQIIYLKLFKCQHLT